MSSFTGLPRWQPWLEPTAHCSSDTRCFQEGDGLALIRSLPSFLTKTVRVQLTAQRPLTPRGSRATLGKRKRPRKTRRRGVYTDARRAARPSSRTAPDCPPLAGTAPSRAHARIRSNLLREDQGRGAAALRFPALPSEFGQTLFLSEGKPRRGPCRRLATNWQQSSAISPDGSPLASAALPEERAGVSSGRSG